VYLLVPIHSKKTLETGEPVEVTRCPSTVIISGRMMTTLVFKANEIELDIAVIAPETSAVAIICTVAVGDIKYDRTNTPLLSAIPEPPGVPQPTL
jgi:hypothetical protein